MEVNRTADPKKFDVVFENKEELQTLAGFGFPLFPYPSLQALRVAKYATDPNPHYPSTITFKAKHLEAAAEELELNAANILQEDDPDRAQELRNMANLITSSLVRPEDQATDL